MSDVDALRLGKLSARLEIAEAAVGMTDVELARFEALNSRLAAAESALRSQNPTDFIRITVRVDTVKWFLEQLLIHASLHRIRSHGWRQRNGRLFYHWAFPRLPDSQSFLAACKPLKRGF